MRYSIVVLFFLVSPLLKAQYNAISKVDSLINESNYDEAIRIIDQQLKNKKDKTFDFLNRKSRILIVLGQFNEAEKNQIGI